MTAPARQYITVLRWRLLRDFRGRHLVVSLIVLIGLSVTFSLFAVGDQERKLEEFAAAREYEEARLSRARTGVELMPVVLVQPSPGSVLLVDNAEETANAALLPGVFGPPIVFSTSDRTNPLLASSVSGGFAVVIVSVIGLIAVTLGHSAFSGGRVMGNIRLTLASGVSRATYFLAELTAITLHCLTLLAIALLVFALVVSSGSVRFSVLSTTFGLFCLLSAGTVVAFVNITLLISAVCRDEGKSLVLSLVTWVVLIWVWPAVSVSGSVIAGAADSSDAQEPGQDPGAAAFVASLPRSVSPDVASYSVKSLAGTMASYLSRADGPPPE